jgi:hypothetical protein
VVGHGPSLRRRPGWCPLPADSPNITRTGVMAASWSRSGSSAHMPAPFDADPQTELASAATRVDAHECRFGRGRAAPAAAPIRRKRHSDAATPCCSERGIIRSMLNLCPRCKGPIPCEPGRTGICPHCDADLIRGADAQEWEEWPPPDEARSEGG